MQRQSAPEHLVDPSGAVTFGSFDGPLRRIDIDATPLEWHGHRLPRALAGLRLKQWQHVGLVLPDAFIGLAVVDLGYLRTTWCHVVDRRKGAHFEHKRMSPWLDLSVGRELWDDRCHVRASGYSVEIRNHLDEGEHRVRIEVAGSGEREAVSADLRCAHDLTQTEPLVVVLPVGPNRGMYSHKVALPLEGSLRIGGADVAIDPQQCFAIWDVHKAHYPRRTFWEWATFAGRDSRGRALAMNLTRNVNRDDAALNENAVWVDGRIELLGPAVFDFDRRRPLEPWHVGTADGAVDLEFLPQGDRHENLRLGVIASVFRQPYGTFRGTIPFRGERLQVDGMFGVCEDHVAVW